MKFKITTLRIVLGTLLWCCSKIDGSNDLLASLEVSYDNQGTPLYANLKCKDDMYCITFFGDSKSRNMYSYNRNNLLERYTFVKDQQSAHALLSKIFGGLDMITRHYAYISTPSLFWRIFTPKYIYKKSWTLKKLEDKELKTTTLTIFDSSNKKIESKQDNDTDFSNGAHILYNHGCLKLNQLQSLSLKNIPKDPNKLTVPSDIANRRLSL